MCETSEIPNDYALGLILHYEMRPDLPVVETQWPRLTRVNENYALNNCQDGQDRQGGPIQGFCPDPVPPGAEVEYLIINRSITYVAVEFPKQGFVQEIGSAGFTGSTVTLGGSVLLPLSAIVLPPNRN
jgi:hypothetical protein